MTCVFQIHAFIWIFVVAGYSEGKHQLTCYEGWTAFGESCYLFKNSPFSFTVGEQYCRQHGGHLVHVNDAMENIFIQDQLRKFKNSHWYLGLTDEDLEHVWKWFDTDTLAEFTDFQPNDGGHHSGEDCAILDVDYDFKWADVACDRAFNIVCEMPQILSVKEWKTCVGPNINSENNHWEEFGVVQAFALTEISL